MSPQRTCLGCRRSYDQSGLVRFVRAPDGSVLVDYRGKLPGRGAYTCLDTACIGQTVKRRQFDRAFHAACQSLTAADIYGRLAEEIRARLEALLGMARKSSQIVSGGNAVLDALERPDQLAVIILAGDVSEGVGDKLQRKAVGRQVPCLVFSTKVGLGQLLGRGERSVTALLKGRLAEAFMAEWQKLKQISGES